MIPTRSPGSTPLLFKSPATRAEPSSSIAYVTTVSSSFSAGRSPCSAAESVRMPARLPLIIAFLPRDGRRRGLPAERQRNAPPSPAGLELTVALRVERSAGAVARGARPDQPVVVLEVRLEREAPLLAVLERDG